MSMFQDDDILKIILRADKVPHGQQVTKIKGSVLYTLKHKLTVYSDTKGEKPMVLDGIFLFNERGDVTSIRPDMELCWTIDVDGLRYLLEYSDPDDGK